MRSKLTVVSQHLKFPTVSLVEPSSSYFIHIAAEVDGRPDFFPSSRHKKQVIALCKSQCQKLRSVDGVLEASVFNAFLVAPGRGEFIKKRPGKVHVARYDLAVLIECKSEEAAKELHAHPAYVDMIQAISSAASFTHHITASNIRCIGPVDHSRQGIFLFNYFFADSVEQNLAIWDYTAGWFQAETGLDNSTVLLPTDAARSNYSIINHCRWDSLGQILPSLIFKKSFQSYVLDNFAANNVAAMPVLYRLA